MNRKPLKSNALRRAPQEYCIEHAQAYCAGCDGPAEPGSVVLAHLPNPGDAGISQKTDDWWGAWLCPDCHHEADHGFYRRDYEWRAIAIKRTISKLIQEGLITVKGSSHV